jgi:hypothetical protein
MTGPLCPNCKETITRARPIRIVTDPDSFRWKGEVPNAVGFTCFHCGVLLPLSAVSPGDELQSTRAEASFARADRAI